VKAAAARRELDQLVKGKLSAQKKSGFLAPIDNQHFAAASATLTQFVF
jgi:hypothetical protein